MANKQTFSVEDIMSYTKDVDGTLTSILLRMRPFGRGGSFQLATLSERGVLVRGFVTVDDPGLEPVTIEGAPMLRPDWSEIPFTFTNCRTFGDKTGGVWDEPGPVGKMVVEVFDANGNLKWSESTENPIEINGIDYLMRVKFKHPSLLKRFLSLFRRSK